MYQFRILLLAIIFFCSSSQPFSELQSLLTPNSGIRSCDISGDNNILVFGTYTGGLHIYKNNGTFFEPNQVLNDVTSNFYESVDITADGQWLLAIDQSTSAAFIYRYNSTSQ